jgi:hypothetical protein
MNRRPHAQDHRADGWQNLDEVADSLLVDLWKIWWRLRREGVELSAEFSVILIEGGKR